MNSLSEELRAQRISKNIPLYEISSRTKINIKYLESIEQGVFDFLPLPFVKAIIKQYAEFIDYPVKEAIKKFDVIMGEVKKETTQALYATTNIPIEAEKTTKEKIDELTTKELISQQKLRRVVAVGTIIFLIFVVGIYIYQFLGEDKTEVTEESFQKIIEEKEPPTPKFTEEVKAEPTNSIPSDSLILTITTLDSIWISISADELEPKNYLLGKNVTKYFKAKNYFIVSAGVDKNIKFKLNGRELGHLSNKSVVLRNIKIDKDFYTP